MKEMLVRQGVKVAVWQWPVHRVLWGKRLQRGDLVSVVAENEDGAMICTLGGDHYCVLWPEHVQLARKASGIAP